MRAIINGRIITESGIVEDKIIIFDNKIRGIYDVSGENEVSADEVIDAAGGFVSPGFIDLHVHGSGGYDTMDASMHALNTISEEIGSNGVTSFLPTTMTMDIEDIKKSMENIRHSMEIVNGARILGCHMEGPFISSKYKGAQNEKDIIQPNIEIFRKFEDIIKIITYAPEEDKTGEFTKYYSDKDVVLSMGHTNATFKEAVDKIDAGVTYATHTFNAMRGLHHREPGALGAVFAKDIYCEIIADGIHVNKDFLDTFVKINGKDKVILVTDCMRAGGMGQGTYELGGQIVYVNTDSARLEDGTLAGSILTMNTAIRNMLENTGLEVHEAINMATINPARAIGIDKLYGSIEGGKVADLVIMDDKMNVVETILGGRTIYK